VVIQILVPTRNGKYPLPYHIFHRVPDQIRIPWVKYRPGDRFAQPDLAINLPKQYQSAVRTDVASVKVRFYFSPPDSSKSN
jgi:hypothetical protein